MKDMTSNIEKKVFKPRPSTGWIWVSLPGLVLLAVGLGLLIRFGLLGSSAATIVPTVVILVLIGIVFLILAAFFPTMRYELDEARLILIYGPWIRYVIELEQIKSIKRRDLSIGVVSSFRFPGLALFSVPYPEVGIVKMCATAATRGILLIETESAKYGLTPANEKEFVAELQRRMGR